MVEDRTEKLQDWDRRFVWHPFTPMQQWSGDPQIIIERAEGSYLIDTRGRRYLDGVSSLWVTLHGHAHPHINQAISDQLKKLDHSTLLGLGNVPSIELAKRLIEHAPQGLAKVFYSDSGSTAVEVALKMAFQYWQQRKQDQQVPNPKKKIKFATLSQAYHGDTIGSVSVGGIDLFHQIYHPLLFQTTKIPSPHCYRCELNLKRETCDMACAKRAAEMIAEQNDEIAAVIVEPLMQGAAGMLRSVAGFLREIRKICTKHHVLMIVDEVATGFGRTGKLFACEWEDVSPDFLCLAKGISGGYLPLAATLTTHEIYQAFLGETAELKTFFHGHTYTGNPLACAAALASFDLFSKADFWKNLEKKIKFFHSRLESLNVFSNVGDIRHQGMMVGIELVRDRKTKEPFAHVEQVGSRVCQLARPKGLLIRPLGNVLVLMPPLSMSEEELGKMVDLVAQSISEFFSGE